MASPPEAHDQHRLRNSCHHPKYNINLMMLVVILLPVLSRVVMSQSIIKTLPGYSGDLPFKLETGYVGVGELDSVQLFYYFIESEGSPKEDPLLLWLTGGPGCSSFTGLVYEIGPLNFNTEDFDGNFPTFILNPYSWTQIASIIFLDAPAGTGFSYANNWESYIVDDTISAAQTYEFLRKWLMNHPNFMSNALYVGGDSYSGMVVPIIVQEIYKGNEVGHKPFIRLKGYMIGNPVTNQHDEKNSRVEYAYRMALLSDELYETTKRNCHGEYVNVDPNNAQCLTILENVTECFEKLNSPQILEPLCSFISPNSTIKWDRRLLEENPTDILLTQSQYPKLWCRSYNYVLSYIWANDDGVQRALHVREGTKKEWVRCNTSMSYTEDVSSSIDYHRNLTNTYYRALIYSGDHDMLVPYLSTHAWIKSLNLSIDDYWKPWFVDGQVAGYSMMYTHKRYQLTFATVKGGGHTAPEYRPKECFAMAYRWFAYYSL